MKLPVRPSCEQEIMKRDPLKGLVEGWYFRQDEVSNNHWVVEGVDLYGHGVLREGADPSALLQLCARDAADIRRRVG